MKTNTPAFALALAQHRVEGARMGLLAATNASNSTRDKIAAAAEAYAAECQKLATVAAGFAIAVETGTENSEHS